MHLASSAAHPSPATGAGRTRGNISMSMVEHPLTQRAARASFLRKVDPAKLVLAKGVFTNRARGPTLSLVGLASLQAEKRVLREAALAPQEGQPCRG